MALPRLVSLASETIHSIIHSLHLRGRHHPHKISTLNVAIFVVRFGPLSGGGSDLVSVSRLYFARFHDCILRVLYLVFSLVCVLGAGWASQ